MGGRLKGGSGGRDRAGEQGKGERDAESKQARGDGRGGGGIALVLDS
jgi:hypothetical protein